MRKNFIGKYASLALMVAALPAVVTSCKDYDDDINNLQGQINNLGSKITSVESAVTTLQGQISSGAVITSVTESADGITVTLSNGQTYTITNGENGTNGTLWTIGDDGFWYEDGVKTEWRAIGEQGPQGPAGPAGSNGTNGTNGKNGGYYYPESDGFWWFIDGDQKTNSGIKWTTSSTTPSTPSTNNWSIVSAGNYIELSYTDKDGKEQTAKIYNGVQLASLEFIPSYIEANQNGDVIGYPTTDVPFYVVDGYLTVPTTNSNLGTTAPTSENYTNGWYLNNSFNKSNVVAFEYRISPSDAYIAETPQGSFINRAVQTRALAAGDNTNLLNVVNQGAKDGVLTVNASYNKLLYKQSNDINKFNFVAYQLNLNGDVNETTTFTTDYVVTDTVNAAPRIIKPTLSNKQPVAYIDNTHPVVMGNNAWENNNYLVNWTGLGYPSDPTANLSLSYGSLDLGVDLNDYVALGAYSYRTYFKTFGYKDAVQYGSWINFMDEKINGSLGFKGITYEFSLPKEYLSNDELKTNQQTFVQLSGSTLSLNRNNLTGSGIQAVGRTPVVRVDAYMTQNNGQGKQLVASSYIKINISQADKPVDEVELQFIPNNQRYGDLASYNSLYAAYQNGTALALPTTLTPNHYMVAYYPWLDFNNNVYGALELTSQTFWNNYGGTNGEYTVTVTAWDGSLDSKKKPVYSTSRRSFSGFSVVQPQYEMLTGIYFSANRFNSNTTDTSNIMFYADNTALSDFTYESYTDDYGLTGMYHVTLTIKSNNTAIYPDVVLYGVFNIHNDFEGYPFNPNYTDYYYNGKYYDVYTIGEVKTDKNTNPFAVDDYWALQMATMETFAMAGSTSARQSIFDYYYTGYPGQYYNIAQDPALTVDYLDDDPTTTKVDESEHDGWELNPAPGSSNDQVIFVNPDLNGASLEANLHYDGEFVNGEVYDIPFNVLFLNPFISGNPSTIQFTPSNFVGNQLQTVANAFRNVIVNAYVNNQPIIKWNAAVLDKNGNEAYLGFTTEAEKYLLVDDAEYPDNALVVYNSTNNTYTVNANSLVSIEFNFINNNEDTDGYWEDYGSQYKSYGEAYNTYVGNLAPGSKLEVDTNGNINYQNLGAGTTASYNLMLVATVHFNGVSYVPVFIPFHVNGSNGTAN